MATCTRELADLPRLDDGRIDVDGLIAALRRRGRVHRFESTADVPDGTGWSHVIPASGRVRWLPVERLAAELLTTDGHDLGHVTALPYDLTTGGARAFVEDVHHSIAVRGERAWLTSRQGATAPDLAGVDAPAPSGSARATPLATAGSARAASPTRVRASLGRARFERAVERIIERIGAGDVYVVNLTQQLVGAWHDDVHALYRALRGRSPAPHGAVIELAPGRGLASVSPEAFLRGDGRELTIRPMKGTRPRSSDPAEDRRLAEDLRTSEKERAENVMIVDLERNDLGRVCEVGTVTARQLWEVEAHPTVWQLVSTVSGRLRADRSYGDALVACFPSGSVTGAPKHSALRVIDELEPVTRGWYCGAFGRVSGHELDTAVTIRTAVLEPAGVVRFGTGSGIVADSDPAAEYDEALLKAEPFLAAINGRLDER